MRKPLSDEKLKQIEENLVCEKPIVVYLDMIALLGELKRLREKKDNPPKKCTACGHVPLPEES